MTQTMTAKRKTTISADELIPERERRARAVVADYRRAMRAAEPGAVTSSRVMAVVASRHGLTEAGVRYILTSRGEYTPAASQKGGAL